jgi:N-acetylglucosamine-6-phosphate deacetylase
VSGATSAILVRGASRTGDPRTSSILIVDGGIRATGEAADSAASPSARRLDADGLIASAGFIDLQVNGAGGHDLTADPSSLAAVAAILPRYGVTAFLATIVSAPYDLHRAAIAALEMSRSTTSPAGAEPLGLHVEGPFLSPERRGVHDDDALRMPDLVATREWSAAAGVAMITLAPELPGALELTSAMVARGIVVSAGHTAASYEVGRQAVEAGVRYTTHLFNAMTPLDHREPGIAAALLADPRVTVGIIPDGLHVHPAMVDLVWRIVGPGRMSAVTDAIAALGMPPGRYRLGGTDVEVDDAGARAGGRLAGSVIGLDTAVRNLAAFTGAGTDMAVGAVTEVPARLLGRPERGHLRDGTVGDVTLLTPELEVAATIVRGRVAYARDEWAGWR